ncbi:3-hydroxyacyl-ACP dehydratase FabZ [Roseospira navarrensis]|uniref:3-hydroxyacyl-[acyl-carrier-protein] dehydratase FabZ n=1 Tax=Roseospira navarrensis TaxID=140058 RepID=A0A7X2D3G1_9PROT|nr:3-hydroxyacyl-ACP dehydratase FabZ [Roseospira navarrensis]MQX37359.1 3-hydroxyacyl-ACP dehydratase FabZ [Roseospira navarrensis]
MDDFGKVQDKGIVIEADRIRDMIPHRYPFLMVDRVVDVHLDDRAVGVKNVTCNEPHFQGHFPSMAVMPGVLVIEAMAQTAGVLVVATLGPSAEGKLVYFMGIDTARFRKPVVPGNQLLLHVNKERNRGNVWKFSGRGMVGDTVVADATFSAMILDN